MTSFNLLHPVPERKARLMEAPIVSIITRTRNRSLLLQRAADSITGQSEAPLWQWILVNDAGNREPVDRIAGQVHKRFPGRVDVLHLETSQGMEHASNIGLRRAKGRFVVIHDDDDSWAPDFLRDMCAWLEAPEHKACAGVVCHSTRIVEVIEDGRIRVLQKHGFNETLKRIDFWEMLQMNRYPPISFLIRREIVEAYGGFDESLPVLGDWEFNLRVLARHPIGLLARSLANYHHRPAKESGAYANSITEGHTRHRKVEDALREKWIRSNPFGFQQSPFAEAVRISAHLHLMKSGLEHIEDRLGRIPEPAPPQY